MVKPDERTIPTMVFASPMVKILISIFNLSYSNSDVLTLVSPFIHSVEHSLSMNIFLYTGEIDVQYPPPPPQESKAQKYKDSENPS